MLMWKII